MGKPIRKAWLVDDDKEMASAVRLMMTLLGIELQAFHHPRLAAKLMLEGQCPDLLILDVSMPEVSGIDMLEFVRRRADWNHLPVIMLSSEASDSLIDAALRLGANAYITKPVTVEELEAAIRKVGADNL